MSCFDNIESFRESKRYLSTTNTTGIRAVYSDLWKSYINLYGVETSYFRHGYELATQDDFIYGEDLTAPFKTPEPIIMIVAHQTDALLLSKFGLESTADLTAIVTIEDYQNAFGLAAEPKAGDVIELTEAAWNTSEMPTYDGIYSHYNVVSDIDSLDIEIVEVDVGSTKLAPVKGVITENVLSYTVPMYTALESVTSNSYPIENDLLPIAGSMSAHYYLKLPINGETYFTPLYYPTNTVTMPGLNSLYFNYDIVDLNAEDVSSAGFVPFSYQDGHLMMPVYTYSNEIEGSGGPVSATVISAASDINYLDVNATDLVCMYGATSGMDYVASLQLELSAVYGSRYIRYPQLFEITEVKYQDYSQQGMNFAQGHYVWSIHAKRFDYSFEPGISSEGPMDQVGDNSFFGTLSSFGNEPSPEKSYSQNITDASKEVFDYDEKGVDTDPYGYY